MSWINLLMGGGASVDALAIVNGDVSPAPILDATGVTIDTTTGKDTAVASYIGRGVFASRPTTPNVPAGASASYLATDTGKFYLWTGSTWARTN